MTINPLQRLQDLLRDLFQFENDDLDFGIYRIMNHKRGEVHAFVDEGLPRLVDDALKGGAVARQAADAAQLRQATDRVRETFGEYAIDPKGGLNENFRETPLGKEYLEARERSGEPVDLEDLKAQIFNHVYTFFSRYYEGGDFLSKRRYSRRHKYAVPYNGEEVYLHWANADQYYVKTGEHFSDYRFKNAGVSIRFELAAADTEQNNVKGERRFFVPRPKDASYDEDARALTIPFEYRPLTAREGTAYGTRNQQERIIEGATTELTARFAKQPGALAALEPAGELERHLRRYTRRNTQDFFVHKDLKGFLEGELDFYLKNEVINVDDLDSWGPERSEGWFEVMRAVKSVGRGVVTFLAQIENFQKGLFEKKKFVVSAEYCLTLDRMPAEFYPEVAASDAQREEWVQLFAIDGIEESITEPGYSEPLTEEFLKANPFLVLDTKHFAEDFKDRLLGSIEDLAEETGGLLIESENFQALNLLQERYREQVKCTYIDPPYNSPGNEILYKNDYKHSSWLSLMANRISQGSKLLTEDGSLIVAIDENEQERLGLLLNSCLPDRQKTCVSVVHNPRGIQGQNFSYSHEYAFFVFPDAGRYIASKVLPQEKWEYSNLRNWGGESTRAHGKNSFYPIYVRDQNVVRLGETPADDFHPTSSIIDVRNGETEIWPIDQEGVERKWRYSRQSLFKVLAATRVVKKNNEIQVQIAKVREKYKTVWVDPKYDSGTYGTRLLGNMLPDRFSFPKSLHLVKDCLSAVVTDDKRAFVLDYFAGSGTTGHAIIDLNREDGGDRKYILVEMGEYFGSVLKPRILKAIYSKDWKDGKPVSREGISHAFKYVKLESYEDALNNIAFTDEEAGQQALGLYGDEYLLRYMLDFETRGSDTLLNVEKLRSPFRYTLRLRNGEVARETVVDLPETFAYLLGMRVRTRRAHHDGDRRYLVYRGTTPDRGEVVTIWRDTEGWTEEDFARDARFVQDNALAAGADEVFVNGDSFIPEARPLEALFKKLMLADPAVG